jgi:multiple sugar transport system permease protein
VPADGTRAVPLAGGTLLRAVSAFLDWRYHRWIIALLLAVAFLFPIAWSLLNSLKSGAEASAVPPTYWPQDWSAGNYRAIWDYGRGLPVYLWNSLVLAALTVAGTVLLSGLGGYGFARFRFPLKNFLFLLCLMPMLVPYQTLLTPLFVIATWLGVHNSLLALSMVYILFQLPFSLFLMRNTFAAIPNELEEAAVMDGCGHLSMLRHVMLQMAKPGLITVALFAFINSWNEFFAALLFLNSEDNFTLPIVLATVRSGQMGVIDWGALQAGVIISIVPCLLLFMSLQRYYIDGLTGGAVKE